MKKHYTIVPFFYRITTKEFLLLLISIFVINFSATCLIMNYWNEYKKSTIINTDFIIDHENKICYDYYSFKSEKGVCNKKLNDFNCGERDTMKFIYEYFKQSEFKDLALEITAMSAIETGWWKSEFHNERNNYWSRKMVPDGVNCIKQERNCLISHNNILQACEKMERYLVRKGYSRHDPELFISQLRSKNFAVDPKYREKLIYVVNLIKKKHGEKLDLN